MPLAIIQKDQKPDMTLGYGFRRRKTFHQLFNPDATLAVAVVAGGGCSLQSRAVRKLVVDGGYRLGREGSVEEGQQVADQRATDDFNADLLGRADSGSRRCETQAYR
jgi:hypothetical protein